VRVVAHRAANDPAALAGAAPADGLVECDVHLRRGRLEVRHAKTLGPLPVWWERWHLVPRPARPALLADVLAALPAGTGLLMDLKGPDPRLPGRVREALRALPPRGPVVVSARVWPHLSAFRGLPGVQTLRSAGAPWHLRLLLARRRLAPHGAVVHRRLLTPGVVAALRGRGARVWTWPVDDAADARRLATWGVEGVISDAPERLYPASSAGR
jgi:glycerophosphoryl diester phosphodiesterase